MAICHSGDYRMTDCCFCVLEGQIKQEVGKRRVFSVPKCTEKWRDRYGKGEIDTQKMVDVRKVQTEDYKTTRECHSSYGDQCTYPFDKILYSHR